MLKPKLLWKVKNNYYDTYEEALTMVDICQKDLEENGIERD